jgi:hypothetical protein
MARSLQLPHCCKTHYIYDFDYDYWANTEEDKQFIVNKTKESINKIIKNKFKKWTGPYFNHTNLLFVATVNNRQTNARQALEEMEFTLDETVDNHLIGSMVYVYKKTINKKELNQ